jgi:hypothetical protein
VGEPDPPLEETYYHPLRYDIMDLLGGIHRGIEDAEVNPLWPRWDIGVLMEGLLEQFFPFEQGDVTSTAPFLQGWFDVCYRSVLEEATEILQRWVSKYHVCPVAFLQESLLEDLRTISEDRSASCFTHSSSRYLGMCAL